MASAAVSTCPSAPVHVRRIVWSAVKVRTALLVLAVLVAAWMRLDHLDAAGFAEDEMDKLSAASAYARGEFAVDGEHPALMKLAVFASVQAVTHWNAWHHDLFQIPLETAVRLPNALMGTLIALVLYGLVRQLFTPLAGILAAWLWALDVNVIAINRIAKEDTFAWGFLLLAAYLFERAKRVGRQDARRAQWWFAAAGGAFGLLLASKYLPFLIGIHILYFRLAEPHPGRNRPDKHLYFGAMALAFVVANFPLFSPGNWATIAAFLSERAVVHTGYAFRGAVWPNTMSASPFGLPVWFYGAALLTKVPLPVLAAAAVGLVLMICGPRTRGSTFVLTFLVLTFVGYSLVATKFLRYMLPVLTMVDVAAGVALAAAWQHRMWSLPRTIVMRAAVVIVLITPWLAWSQARPFPGLHRNVLGQLMSPRELWFPPDELYDAGLREAAMGVSAKAALGTRVFTDAPSVVTHYLHRFGRDDLRVVRLSGQSPSPGDWVLAQDGRQYFETRQLLARLRQTLPVLVIRVNGFRAAELYGVDRGTVSSPPVIARRTGS